MKEVDTVGTSQTEYGRNGSVLGHEEEDSHHTEGVALMLSHEAQNAIINWVAA